MSQNSSLPVAIVTGASGGVGLSTVRQLAKTHRVVGLARSDAGLNALAQIPGVTPERLDLLDAAAVEVWAAKASDQFSEVSALVHTAAISAVRDLEDSDPQLWQDMFTTNVIAPALLTRGLLPSLRAADGTVVFVNSGAGQRPVPRHAIYTATKHALTGFADTLRLDEPKLRVTTVFPGPINTPMLQRLRNHSEQPIIPGEYAEPESVARAILWAIHATPEVQISNIDVRPRHEPKSRP